MLDLNHCRVIQPEYLNLLSPMRPNLFFESHVAHSLSSIKTTPTTDETKCM